MLHCCAIDRAVNTLSPVHIVTRTPAFLHLATASRTPSRRGSSIPVMPISVRSVARSSYSTCQWPVSGRDLNNKRNCYLSVVHELRARTLHKQAVDSIWETHDTPHGLAFARKWDHLNDLGGVAYVLVVRLTK